MDHGVVTLLEICQMAHGNRVACCLTTGEFLFVTKEAPQYCGASSALDLFGKNICQFLVPYDLEKLQDYMRAQPHTNTIASNDVSAKLTMMVRLVGTGQPLWIRLKTIPLSLRLLRCIDSVTVLARMRHHFADNSNFVVSEDEMASIINPSSPQNGSSSVFTGYGDGNSGDGSISYGIIIQKPHQYDVPVELKSASSFDERLTMTSPKSPNELMCSMDDCSLSSLAFEADWAREVEPSSHTSANNRIQGHVL